MSQCESCAFWRQLEDPDPVPRTWPPAIEWGECRVDAKEGDTSGVLTRFTYGCDRYQPK